MSSARPAPPGDPPPDTISALEHISSSVATAFIHLEAVDRRVLRNMSPPLTSAQFHALVALSRSHGQTLGSLARTMLCDKANASGIVHRLVGAGLVDNSPDPDDGRRVALTLTEAGREALATAIQRRSEALGAALNHLNRDQLDSVTDELARLVGALEQAATTVHD